MKLTACVVLLVVLTLLLPDQSAGWRRRRRRRRCYPVHCSWGNWGSFSACTAPCGSSGTQTRTRSIARHALCGGSGCSGPSSETRACNRGCPNGGNPFGPRCSCTGTGFTGTCCNTDVNECTDGSHTCNREHGKCTNTRGSYTCRCAEDYVGDGRTCTSIHAGTGWQYVAGGLKFVSVGRSGVWGVNSNDQIYYRTGTYGDEASAGTGWVRIDGALKQISSGDNIVWGVNSNDDIYIRQGICWSSPGGLSWRHIPGKLKQVHVSPTSNQVWGVNSGDYIYRRTGITASNPAGTGWQHISGQLKFVSVGLAGVWGVNNNDQIYYRTGTSGNETVLGTGWERVSGAFKVVSSGNGVVWGVNSNNEIFMRAVGPGGGQCRYGAVFVEATGRCQCPSVCPANYDPVCGSDGQQHGNECSMRVAGCHTQQDIYRVGRPPCRSTRRVTGTRSGTPQGSSWHKIGGSLMGVHVSPSSNQVWGVNAANSIYRRQGIAPVSPQCGD